MKIKSGTNKFINFGITVSPKMKYIIFKETKKFYTRKEASKLLSMIEKGSDSYSLEGFKMSVPDKKERNIFCDIFINSKQKNGKSCLIHSFLGKLKRKIQYNPLAKIIKNT